MYDMVSFLGSFGSQGPLMSINNVGISSPPWCRRVFPVVQRYP